MTAPLERLHRKIVMHRRAASEKAAQWRRDSEKVVFTNGCFDLLHRGHITYLAEAAALGDRLIIGVNDDASVQRLKGPQRPILPLEDRLFQLAAFFFVDMVIPFSEDTPYALIEALVPDILVKGGDYAPEAVVGKDVVEAHGGRVVIIPFIKGYSTSRLISKIQQHTRLS